MKLFLLFILYFTFSALHIARGQTSNLSWKLETEHAAWQARDSQGEVVYKNKLWILGGWFNSFEAPPRDVWQSANGKDWKMLTGNAPWKHSDLPFTTVFKNRMWLMGGWFNGRLPGYSASSEVWHSGNGKKWKLATATPGWTPRAAAATVVFKDKMLVLGGTENYYFGDSTSLKNDVWATSDGKKWDQLTEKAPWSPRAYHQAVVLKDRIYVMGGGNYVPDYHATHDVWSSADGVHWELETAHAPWHERLWFSSVVYRDRIWVIGGWSNNPYKNWSDVWYSENGKDWHQLQTGPAWKERHELSAFVFQDKLWVAGGMVPPLVNDVWSLFIPADFFKDSPGP